MLASPPSIDSCCAVEYGTSPDPTRPSYKQHKPTTTSAAISHSRSREALPSLSLFTEGNNLDTTATTTGTIDPEMITLMDSIYFSTTEVVNEKSSDQLLIADAARDAKFLVVDIPWNPLTASAVFTPSQRVVPQQSIPCYVIKLSPPSVAPLVHCDSYYSFIDKVLQKYHVLVQRKVVVANGVIHLWTKPSSPSAVSLASLDGMFVMEDATGVIRPRTVTDVYDPFDVKEKCSNSSTLRHVRFLSGNGTADYIIKVKPSTTGKTTITTAISEWRTMPPTWTVTVPVHAGPQGKPRTYALLWLHNSDPGDTDSVFRIVDKAGFVCEEYRHPIFWNARIVTPFLCLHTTVPFRPRILVIGPDAEGQQPFKLFKCLGDEFPRSRYKPAVFTFTYSTTVKSMYLNGEPCKMQQIHNKLNSAYNDVDVTLVEITSPLVIPSVVYECPTLTDVITHFPHLLKHSATATASASDLIVCTPSKEVWKELQRYMKQQQPKKTTTASSSTSTTSMMTSHRKSDDQGCLMMVRTEEELQHALLCLCAKVLHKV
eukprot:PhF_6_TR25601/c0_g1_i1/m.35919